MHVTVHLPNDKPLAFDSEERSLNVDRAFAENPRILTGFLRDVANDVFKWSQYFVPVDTGYLKSTGYVKQVGRFSFEVGYTAPYAIYVHEILGYKHKYPTRAKFLTQAFSLVMTLLVTSFGSENIPNFNVTFVAKPNMHLRISGKKDLQSKFAHTWRRWVPL